MNSLVSCREYVYSKEWLVMIRTVFCPINDRYTASINCAGKCSEQLHSLGWVWMWGHQQQQQQMWSGRFELLLDTKYWVRGEMMHGCCVNVIHTKHNFVEDRIGICELRVFIANLYYTSVREQLLLWYGVLTTNHDSDIVIITSHTADATNQAKKPNSTDCNWLNEGWMETRTVVVVPATMNTY